MKIRTGFVSNSSSSSFVVISKEGNYEPVRCDGELRIYGENEFGWQNEMYFDWASKANFAMIQTQYFNDIQRELYQHMIEKVIKEHTGASSLVWQTGGYIDHQSSAAEGTNLEMFDSEEEMKSFIFEKDSYIQNGNDNE